MKSSLVISSLVLVALFAVASADPIENRQSMQIVVKTLTGKSLTIATRSDETISSVKSKVQALEAIPINEQQLFFGGVPLENQDKLSDYDIQQDCVLHLLDEKTKLEEARKHLEELGDQKFKQLFGNDVDIGDLAFHSSHDSDEGVSQLAGQSIGSKLRDFLGANKDTVANVLQKLLEMFINSRTGRN